MMAHSAQAAFMAQVRNKFPSKFTNCDILDVGSLDINGSNRFLLGENCRYIGLDVGAGRNVDIICPVHEYESNIKFDTIISTECFEHDMHYEKSLKRIVKLLKNGGLFAFTCASTGRPEHGTRRTDKYSSPLTTSLESNWSDYYLNLTEKHITDVIDVDRLFSKYYFEYNHRAFDLYFWGIKR